MDKKTLAVVGDTLVGKTCLVRCLMESPLDEYSILTIMDTFSMEIDVRGQTKELVIHDMPGVDIWDRLRWHVHLAIDIVMIVFDISNRDSLSNAYNYWYPEVSYACFRRNVPIILVGNKKDLRNEKGGMIDYAEGKLMAKRIGAQDYLECSTTTLEGIHDLLGKAIKILFPDRPRAPGLFTHGNINK